MKSFYYKDIHDRLKRYIVNDITKILVKQPDRKIMFKNLIFLGKYIDGIEMVHHPGGVRPDEVVVWIDDTVNPMKDFRIDTLMKILEKLEEITKKEKKNQ